MFSTGVLLQLLVSVAREADTRRPPRTRGGRRAPCTLSHPRPPSFPSLPRPPNTSQGCVLWRNWWPMLTALMYVLVPMPLLFFGPGSYGSNSSSSYGAVAGGWVDAGKFLTGFSAVGSVAIPAVLAHARIITPGALAFELAAAGVLGATVVAWDFYASQEAGGGGYY
jgi:hypothetical protein